ncbi:NADH-ubiquinoneoxido reductase, putative [Coccidioides posadasii C735 delta SOWgp]|uniref:Acyl carrier protein n=1 Tax=Coccidioides posadasii (strain C735) TaxID=222929 RepID=C5P902_COCP7|nr:NADH-ubiquinoneoxido reductase, putative [Coccidioides posadasii C735 delta SOWgp]EER26214.1 NADH-ubiquinoneoxido reductase, putative [Coccidioides posadasii C735 delta SOWgp]|eukprot:XP_003068359.1 NADH-ubiquinoneoxido reductase, putative [Coccidioides posadasii C735 delta SOWgp]
MFRSALIRSLRTVSIPRAVRNSSTVRQLPRASAIVRQSQFAPCIPYQAIRSYSAPAGLNQSEVEGRIIDLLRNFDKITPTSHFTNDLGLDSLDTVEVVMAIEEEFSIEIPDKEADAIHSIDQAVQYILSQPDGL